VGWKKAWSLFLSGLKFITIWAFFRGGNGFDGRVISYFGLVILEVMRMKSNTIL
jgi:hypothetical protein